MPDEKLITLEPYALLYTRAGAGVCLRDPLTGKAGVIFMELADGMALERSLNGERPVRPDTSSLLSHFLSAMECRVRLVLINGRKDEVFYARVAVEAAVKFGWERWIGEEGGFVGMSGFGASGSAEELYKHFGITAEAIADAAMKRHNNG